MRGERKDFEKSEKKKKQWQNFSKLDETQKPKEAGMSINVKHKKCEDIYINAHNN